MTKTIAPGQNPALRMAKEKASRQFTATKRVLASGTHKSSIGTFPAARVITNVGTTQRKK
jgi:hypothetical protein